MKREIDNKIKILLNGAGFGCHSEILSLDQVHFRHRFNVRLVWYM